MTVAAIEDRWLAVNERWKAYGDATRGPAFARWAAEHCVQSDDRFADLPLELEWWQRDIASEVLAEREDPESGWVSYWHTAALIIPKGNGKSSLLAALALYELVETGGSPEVLLCAATDAQAGRLFESAVRFVKRDPWLSARLVIREHVGHIVRVDGLGTLRRVSGDALAAGYNPSVVIADELSDWNTPRRRSTWADLVSAGKIKRDQARVIIISTAGEPHERADGILGRILDANERDGQLERPHRALTISRDHASRTLVYSYCAHTEDPLDTDAIRAANPASWIATRKLAELAKSPALTAGRYLQLHACCWVSSTGAFLTLEEWRSLERPAAYLEPGEEVTLGFRGGGGSWALMACRRSDGTLFTLAAEDPDLPGGDPHDNVDRALQHAVAAWRVGAVFASASPQWCSLVDDWGREIGRKRVVDHRVEQPGPRTAAMIERFAADARAGLVGHDGDPILAAHMLAAQLATSERGHVYLAADAQQQAPIAAALAAVLAWEAKNVTDPAPLRGLVGDISDYRILPLG